MRKGSVIIKTVQSILKTHPCIKKMEKPILTKDDIPYSANLIFNAGVAKFHNQYVMIFRNDYGVDQKSFECGDARMNTSVGINLAEPL